MIALTGHTAGFGTYLNQALQQLGHTVVCFSRSNGYDLSTPDGRTRLLIDSHECEVFINNSCAGDCQYLLLTEWLELNRTTNKKIINIGSYLSGVGIPATEFHNQWYNKNQLAAIHNNFLNTRTAHDKCVSEIVEWGYWECHPIAVAHPEIITNLRIDEAVAEILSLL